MISTNLSGQKTIFVTTNGDIYVDNGFNGRVERWIAENETWIPVMSVSSPCYGLFIDICDNLYCSMFPNHRVDKKWPDGTRAIVAGTGIQGSSLDMLNAPHGIFVDINFDLYVADSENDRIQLFRLNQTNGITVAGNGSLTVTIDLHWPISILLDGDRNLFILDYGNSRIVRSDENNHFHCIFGCSGEPGFTNDKLAYSTSMSFDSYGNIYVSDSGNRRVQKIHLSKQSQVLTLSYNQPRFHSNATWDANATTFTNESIVGQYPGNIFVNSKNTIYTYNPQTNKILIWENKSSDNPSKTISTNLSDPQSIFVTTNGDIYVDNEFNGRVDKWIAENETWIPVMSVSSPCYGLFIDICDNLYCSMFPNHRVDKKWPDGTRAIVAGTGIQGSSLDMLNAPHGIFVDINFDLYVADSENDRIQLFRLNQTNGITVAGNGSLTVTIDLRWPISIVLDGDRNLFILDSGNGRIIRSDENNHFYCIFGCSDEPDSTNDKLAYPTSMSFDSYGNIYIVDQNNHRVQKIMKIIFCRKFSLYFHILSNFNVSLLHRYCEICSNTICIDVNSTKP